jgi:hypothetical protein
VCVTDPITVRMGIEWDIDDQVDLPELPAMSAHFTPATHAPDGRRYISGSSDAVARRRLAALCRIMERAPVGGRHRRLIWAAARAIELDDALPRASMADDLISAAQRAGLTDQEADLARQVKNGFRIGIFGSGAGS